MLTPFINIMIRTLGYKKKSSSIMNHSFLSRIKLAERTGKDIPITIKKNETGQNAKDVVPDLRDLIQFDIVEENF